MPGGNLALGPAAEISSTRTSDSAARLSDGERVLCKEADNQSAFRRRSTNKRAYSRAELPLGSDSRPCRPVPQANRFLD